MQDVVFQEEEDFTRPKIVKEKKQPLFNRLIIQGGLAKNESEANIILIVFAAAFLLLSFFILLLQFFPQLHPQKTPAEQAFEAREEAQEQ